MILGKKSKRARGTRVPGHGEGAHGASRGQGAEGRIGRELRVRLLRFFRASARDLPWRRTRDPYAIWVSEVMLQQTRVETVVPYFARFLDAFPTVHALADAPLDRVLAQWSGLGYYRRARLLHRGAQAVASELGGVLPQSAEGLLRVPGIGRYTAGAVASIAFGEPAPIVDGNVARVLSRIFAIEDDIRTAAGIAALWSKASELVVGEDPGALNQALMELGATVCTPRAPRCGDCPAAELCIAFRDGRQSELPRVKERKPQKRWRRVALVATEGSAVLLGRRREDLVFGGLWEPPAFDWNPAVSPSDPGAAIGVRLRAPHDLGVVHHVLSHRRMEVRVHSGALASPVDQAKSGEHERFALFPPSELGTVGLSTLARKILGLLSRG